jgi:hypothetical protein
MAIQEKSLKVMVNGLLVDGGRKTMRYYDKFDRFDFEQQIMSCWNITTDLKDLNEGVLESNLSKDQISNALMGIEQLYELRFNKLFQQFETLVHEYAHTLDRDSDAIDEFNSEQIRKFHEAQQELPL